MTIIGLGTVVVLGVPLEQICARLRSRSSIFLSTAFEIVSVFQLVPQVRIQQRTVVLRVVVSVPLVAEWIPDAEERNSECVVGTWCRRGEERPGVVEVPALQRRDRTVRRNLRRSAVACRSTAPPG